MDVEHCGSIMAKNRETDKQICHLTCDVAKVMQDQKVRNKLRVNVTNSDSNSLTQW